MISFDVKIVLHVLLESSVTTRFPTTSRPAGVEPDWADNSDFMVNAQERRGTDGGHDLVLVPRPRIRLRNHIHVYLSSGRANHRILPVTDEQRVARGKVASYEESVAP